MHLSRITSPRLKHLTATKLRLLSTSTETDENIQIPNRIRRTPTDILRALETTIKRDPTAAHYKYHDDPYLIPTSNIGKRSFALAQEAGRKAAHWIRKEHADLFQHKEADPPIEAFFPKMVYTEKSEVTEKDLEKAIKSAMVTDAITVYKLLQNKNINISPGLQQSLLELVCFYNSEDTLSDEFIEERWFKQSSKGRERQRKTWKDGAFAEELFISIDKPDAKIYSAVIQGMAKHCNVERAMQLFAEAQSNGIVVNTNTYNSVISISHFLKEGYDLRWMFILDMLSNMKTAKVKPNLGTLNAVLGALSAMGGTTISKQNVKKTLAEFSQLGIEPSLASWYYVLITFCKERGPVSAVLHDIMPKIENKEHKIRDIKDTYFFVTAMDVCRNHLQDVSLAKRVHALLNFENNYNLIGDSYKESIYYRHYLILLCTSVPFEEFMKHTYDTLVPHIYIPEPSVMGVILKNVDISGAIHYIPKLWSDMTIFDHQDREDLVVELLHIMVSNKPDDKELVERFSVIGWDIYSVIENQNPLRTQQISFTGDMLGDIMILVLRNNDFEKASVIMEKLDKNHNVVVGVPKIEALSLYVDECINKKLPSQAINCIQYCSDSGFPDAADLAAKLNESLTLDETHLNRLTKIVGNIPLITKQSSQQGTS